MAQKTRTYSSSRRTAQAAQTRADVIAAAMALFRERGWAGTTIAAIAERAGVATETVYAGFKSKKALLRAAIDFAVVGDTEPIPYIERPEVQALGQGPLEARMRAGMRLQWTIHNRISGVWMALLEAAANDPEIDEWRVDSEAGRKSDVSRSLTMIFGHELDNTTLDLIVALYSSEVFVQLRERGWSQEQYEQEMYEASRLLIERPKLPSPRRPKQS